MANWNRMGDTRDPVIIFEEREQRSCAGCVHRTKLWGLWVCEKLGQPALNKCKRYRETA